MDKGQLSPHGGNGIDKIFPSKKQGRFAIVKNKLQFAEAQQIVDHHQGCSALGYAKDRLDGLG